MAFLTMNQDTLRHKTTRALFWSFLETAGLQGIQFIISIILARMLLPEQYGLIAMLAIFMAIAQTFINSGFGQALIQRKNINHVDECSIFYFNILVSFLAAGLLCLAAPWVADFYNQPLLIPLTRVLSLNLIINAFGAIQTTLLTKLLDFKTQLKVSMIATFLSGTIGITMAFNGFGVWSLVAQSLSSNLFRTILLWFFTNWRPSLVFSLKALREMFGFGSRFLASGLLDTVFRNIYVVVIGKLFAPAALGLYSKAHKLQKFPTVSLSSIIGRVTFPVFSTIHDDSNRLKSCMRKALTTVAFANFPLMIGLALVAEPLILLLLKEKWLPCVPYLQLLCIAGLLYPLHVINRHILMAKGRSDLFLRLEVLKKILVVISIAVTYQWGIIALIYGQIIVSVVAYYINSYYTGKLIGYPLKEQVFDFAPYLGLGIVMGTAVYSVRWLAFSSSAVLLVSQVLAGVFFYTAMNYIFKMSAFVNILEILRDKLKRLILRKEFSKYYG